MWSLFIPVTADEILGLRMAYQTTIWHVRETDGAIEVWRRRRVPECYGSMSCRRESLIAGLGNLWNWVWSCPSHSATMLQGKATTPCAIYTNMTHHTGAYCISLVHIGLYWFVPVPTNSHRVRIASHHIDIDSPSPPPYCFVLHRIVIALVHIASNCILSVCVQFLLIHTYYHTMSY